MLLNTKNKIICSEYKNQLLVTLSVNLLTFSHGIVVGWFSPVLPILQSEHSPLDIGRSVSVTEASWIGSCLCVGAFIGNALFGIMITLTGRKITLFLLAVPHICFWLLVMFSTEVYHLYIARILGGSAGGGLFISIPIFISEISDNNFRGTLGSAFILAFNAGILAGFVLSSYLPYFLMPQIILAFPLIYILLISFFPETPQYLLRQKQEERAENSLKFYRNFKGNTKEEIQTFNEIFNTLKLNMNGIENDVKKNQRVTIKDFVTPAALKGIFIGLVLMFLNQFTGIFAIVNYSATIFNKTGSSFDSNISTIVIGCIQIVGTYIATILCDKTGRKILLTVSSFGTSIGLITLGLHSYFWKDYDLDWLPVTSLSFAIFLSCLGLLPLPFVVMIEILPRKIRSIASTACMCLLSTFSFMMLKSFPILLETIQLYGVMWLCGSICLGGAIFVLCFLPETKGKCLDTDE